MRATRHIAAAYHEAGHAVAAAALGRRFDCVWISGPEGRIDPRRDGGILFAWRNDFTGAVMAAAGPVAEAKRMRRALFSVFIAGGAADWADLNGHDIDAAVRHAKELLREHWHAVEAVAAGLLQRGILIEAEVLEHFRFP
ncbi:MAG: hypothetical protein ABIK08_19685 [Pseudomonadota bacterium]